MADEQKSHVLLKPTTHKADEMPLLPIEVPTVYSNNALIKFTNWDAALIFSELVSQGMGEDEVVAIKPRVKVVMSHPHLKAFVGALVDTLAAFENQMGEIKILGVPQEATGK